MLFYRRRQPERRQMVRERYFVGVEVLLVLVIPIEFYSSCHRSILYRNVYTL
jgi:hypothetical protein